jgi:uncharacterized membrane protein YdjX (TVP38/TMEM64 family)
MEKTPSGARPAEAAKRRVRLIVGLALLGLLAALYAVLHLSGAVHTLMDREALQAWVARLGPWGPVAIVGMMLVAILISPIPSAPIALAAGAAYGHGWGALYVLLGAQVGAMLAFAVARLVGHETVHRWFGQRLSLGLIGNQNTLMAIVFVSRLLPFISFDIVSYAAGLTLLSTWRFALATLAGIAPSSFLLAHFGTEIGSGEGGRILGSLLALGALTALPLVAKLVHERWKRRRDGHRPDAE